jgi:BclB C-terminal domain-containing protein
MLLFASGNPAAMTTIEGGLPGVPAFVGFGASGQMHGPLSSTINLENLLGYVSGFYFTIPFTIEINSLSAFYNAVPLSPEIPQTVTVRAQLYEAEEGSGIFSPIEETLIILTPSITAATPPGTLLKGEIRTNRVVEKNTSLMLVFSATANGPDKIDRIWGYANASLVYT